MSLDPLRSNLSSCRVVRPLDTPRSSQMNRIATLSVVALVLSCSGSETPAPEQLSNDATLSSLTVSAGALSPGFAPATRQYALSVPYGTGTLRVTPSAADASALSVAVRQDNNAFYALDSGQESGALAVPAVG